MLSTAVNRCAIIDWKWLRAKFGSIFIFVLFLPIEVKCCRWLTNNAFNARKHIGCAFMTRYQRQRKSS